MRATGRCDFLSDQKVTKESPGTTFDERLCAAGAHRRLVPEPLFTGDALLSDRRILSAARRQDLWSFLPRGHRPLPGENLKCLRCTDTAYLGITVAAGLSDHRRTQQVGRQ